MLHLLTTAELTFEPFDDTRFLTETIAAVGATDNIATGFRRQWTGLTFLVALVKSIAAKRTPV